MPEIDSNLAAGAGATAQNAGENSQAGTNQKTAPDTQGKEGSAGEKKDGKVETPATEPQKTGEDDLKEPPMRQRLSKEDFIIGRQRAKLAKAQANKANEAKDTENTDEEGDEIAPEEEEMISKVVAKKFAPIIDKSLADDDNREISDFLAKNPDFKPFEAKARRYMQHPSRRSLPIQSIFYEVAGDQLMKIGADRARQAEEKAKNSQTGGGSNRAGEGGQQDDWKLSKDEFTAKQERIRRGQ